MSFTLLPGKYHVTATIRTFIKDRTVEGRRIGAELYIDSAGALTYAVKSIEPNPTDWPFESGSVYAEPGWEDGDVKFSRTVAFLPTDIHIQIRPSGTLKITASALGGSVVMAEATGAWAYRGQATPPIVGPPPQQPAAGFRFATDFLTGWPGGACDLFLLSPATTQAERFRNYQHKKECGYTVACTYFENTGDGDGKHPVHALSDAQHTEAVLQELHTNGFGVVGFLYSDSHKVAKKDQAKHAADIVRKYNSRVVAWNLFLEPKDTTDDATLDAVGKAVRAETDKLIFIHTYPAASDPASIKQYTKRSWCDGVLVQVSHPSKPVAIKDVAKIASGLLANANGKYVVAMEYSWTATEKALGDEFARRGLHGCGDGCNKSTVASLPILERTSAPAVPGTPTTPTTGLKFTRVPSGKKDVKWSPGTDRSDRSKFPIRRVDGADCDGILYGCEVGGVPEKVEWIKVGENQAHTDNAWAYRKDPKYNQGWAAGKDVVLQVRNTRGELVVNSWQGEVTL